MSSRPAGESGSDGHGAVEGELGRLENRSLTSRARDMLLDSIVRGVFVDGRLPPEPKLAAQLGVSRTTVRNALRSLEDQGVIKRQRGVGTIVNRHVVRSTISLNRVVGFHQLITESGYSAEIAWTKIKNEQATPELAAQLECEIGDPILSIYRLMLADGEPAIHLVETMAARVLRREVRAEDVPTSIFNFVDAYCHEPIDHTILELRCATASEDLSKILRVSVDLPLLRLIESHYGGRGNPLMVSSIHVVDRIIRLAVVRTRG